MKVLVADDEVVSRRLIESSVERWGYEPVVANDGLEASKILHGPNAPKLAILDWMMPGLDGIQLCRTLRGQKSEAYTYVLLLTAKQTKSDIIEGLEAGADDYITKPFDPSELRVRLRTGKRILYLLDQLTTARETLRDLAAHDSLTKLWNRTSMIDLLQNEMERSRRQGASVGVVIIDLDHFKQVNDTYGHLVGDQVLCEVARLMREMTRPYDAVGRFGGEEFLMVLPGCDQINAASHAERIRQAFARAIVKAGETEVRFTASFGVTAVGPDTDVNVETAIRVADFALYAAKRAGRNCVEFLPASAELTPA
jgi:diguanylate cyclase (GGDEF)-like protein